MATDQKNSLVRFTNELYPCWKYCSLMVLIGVGYLFYCWDLLFLVGCAADLCWLLSVLSETCGMLLVHATDYCLLVVDVSYLLPVAGFCL